MASAGNSDEENYPYEELIADANQHAEKPNKRVPWQG
jgi:hypothetical protein